MKGTQAAEKAKGFWKRNRSVILFSIGVVVAGVLHTMEKTLTPVLSTLFFCLSSAIYIGLIIVWLLSAWHRLLPTRGRAYIAAAGAIAGIVIGCVAFLALVAFGVIFLLRKKGVIAK